MKHIIAFRALVEIEVDVDTSYMPIVDATAGALLLDALPGEGQPYDVAALVRGPNLAPHVAEGRARLTVDKGLFEVSQGTLSAERPEGW